MSIENIFITNNRTLYVLYSVRCKEYTDLCVEYSDISLKGQALSHFKCSFILNSIFQTPTILLQY